MRYILDRFEEDAAVVEAGGEWLRLPRAALPPCAREGDVLLRAGEGDVLLRAEEGWQVDEAASQNRREALRARFAGIGRKTEK